MHPLYGKFLCFLGYHEPIRQLVGVRRRRRKTRLYIGLACARCGKTLKLETPL